MLCQGSNCSGACLKFYVNVTTCLLRSLCNFSVVILIICCKLYCSAKIRCLATTECCSQSLTEISVGVYQLLTVVLLWSKNVIEWMCIFVFFRWILCQFISWGNHKEISAVQPCVSSRVRPNTFSFWARYTDRADRANQVGPTNAVCSISANPLMDAVLVERSPIPYLPSRPVSHLWTLSRSSPPIPSIIPDYQHEQIHALEKEPGALTTTNNTIGYAVVLQPR